MFLLVNIGNTIDLHTKFSTSKTHQCEIFINKKREKSLSLTCNCCCCRSYVSLVALLPDADVDDESFCSDNTNSDFGRVNANA